MTQQNQPQQPGSDDPGYGWANTPGYGRPGDSPAEPQGYAYGQQFGSVPQYGPPQGQQPTDQYGQPAQYGQPTQYGQPPQQYGQQAYGAPQYGQPQYPYGMPPAGPGRPVWKTVLGIFFVALAGLFTLGLISSAASGDGPDGSGAAYMTGYIFGQLLVVAVPALIAWLLLRRK